MNLASAEFGEGTKLGTNFVYPNRAEFAYYPGKGLKLVRIPFLWERVQPRLRGELDAANLAELDRCISQADASILSCCSIPTTTAGDVSTENGFMSAWPGNRPATISTSSGEGSLADTKAGRSSGSA